ncbi:hypothetical protein [Enterococcus sp. AZ072]|uniref:hypothetical protein n=1 Tax=unclassified Enterococcus TaxID=2608891 RepID=UPI003D2A52DF
MNKQELLNWIESSRAMIKKLDFTDVSDDDRADYLQTVTIKLFKEAEDLVSELREPQQIKVPKAAAEWLSENNTTYDLIELYSDVQYATDSEGLVEAKWKYSVSFYDWLSDDTDKIFLLADAMRYGYEVIPGWIVRVGEMLIYKSFEDGERAIFIIDDGPGFILEATVFADKEKAERIANEVGGKVEPAEVPNE